MNDDSKDRFALAVERRKEVDRLAPYLLAGMRFAEGEHVANRGQGTGHMRQRYCEGGCGTVLVQSSPCFICHECRTFAIETERRVLEHVARCEDLTCQPSKQEEPCKSST